MDTCPDPATLKHYIAETLSAHRQREVESHVGACSPCQQALAALLPSLPFLGFDPSTVIERVRETVGSDEQVPEIPGYDLSGEVLGSGGMGVVWLGRDTALQRDVAVKVMRGDLCDRHNLLRRFLEEARLTSQLQHPGIPPIHALGTLSDGRPYFVMKVVRGSTFAALLKGREATGSKGLDALADLPRWLSIFEQVCQAVAYAHSKGVIHRDLKPHNIMVGAFGEVQVMDWGLAKVLSRSEGLGGNERGAFARVVATTQVGDEPTHPGTVLGTWAYMPPEQARGEVETLDCRGDVFGLGAILCEVLTTRPPYGGTSEELQAAAQAGNLGPAEDRLAACGADAELIGLARACLKPHLKERPSDAGVVTSAVAAYRASVQERLRKAELSRAAAEARAEEEVRTRHVAEGKAVVERRARRLTVVLALAGVLLLSLLGTGLWWLRIRQQATDASVIELLTEAGLLRDREAARGAEKLAQSAGASAEVRRRAALLVETLEEEYEADKRDRLLLSSLLEVSVPREGPLVRNETHGSLVVMTEPSREEQFAAAFRAWHPPWDVDALSIAELVAPLKSRPPAVVTEVVAALDAWTSERRRLGMPAAQCQQVAEVAAALDTQGAKSNELRQILSRGALTREKALGALAMFLCPVPVPFDAGWGKDRSRLRRIVEATDAAQEPVLGLLALVRALRDAGEEADAERLLRQGLLTRPREIVLHYTLGQVREEQGRFEEARECYAAARALRPELGVSLAKLLVKSGRVDEGLELFEHLHTAHPENAWLHNIRGIALDERGRHAEAETAFRQALRLKADFSEAHNNLGLALRNQGKFAEADRALRAATVLKPQDPEPHNNLGGLLVQRGQIPEAEKSLRQALALRPDYPEANGNLGAALFLRGQPDEAAKALRRALGTNPNLPPVHYNLGNVLLSQNQRGNAEAAFREALRLNPRLFEAHFQLGSLLYGQDKLKDAEEAFRAALRVKPRSAEVLSNLGTAVYAQGRWEEAEHVYREAVGLDPENAVAHRNLAIVLLDRGKWEESVASYLAAIQRRPEFAQAYFGLGKALKAQGRFDEALRYMRQIHERIGQRPGESIPTARWVSEYERLVALGLALPSVLEGKTVPSSAMERLEYASLCRLPYRRLHVTATRLATEAFALEPNLASDLRRGDRYNAACSAVLAAAGQAEDAKTLSEDEKARLRRQALGWLQADLALHGQRADREASARHQVQQTMQDWQQDVDLAAVRSREARDRLPADERKEWGLLWEEVAHLVWKIENHKSIGEK